MTRSAAWFLLGALISIVTVVELRGCGPKLEDRINEGICIRTGGAWVDYECVRDNE